MNDNPFSPPDDFSPASQPERQVYRDAEDELFDNSAAVRCLGAVSIAIGISLGYLGIYTPLQNALNGAQTLHIPLGAASATVGATLCGVVMLIAGRHTRTVLVHRWYDATPLSAASTLALIAIAVAAEIWFESLLSGLGYVF